MSDNTKEIKCLNDPALQTVDTEKLLVKKINDSSFNYVDVTQLAAKLKDVTNIDSVVPKEYLVNEPLMSAEEYNLLSVRACNKYWENNTILHPYSEPKYKCPKCSDGGMCRDNTKVLTSLPPKYEYKCNKCGHIEYKYI